MWVKYYERVIKPQIGQTVRFRTFNVETKDPKTEQLRLAHITVATVATEEPDTFEVGFAFCSPLDAAVYCRIKGQLVAVGRATNKFVAPKKRTNGTTGVVTPRKNSIILKRTDAEKFVITLMNAAIKEAKRRSIRWIDGATFLGKSEEQKS